jgi:DNA-binding LacI/PurR family transcriptional regulator
MNKKEKVNIKLIARKARVSIATVSRVVNGFQHVDDDTRKRVMKVIEKYDYTPHFFGRGLSTKESRSIGLITPLHFSPSSYYFTEIFRGIVEEAAKGEYCVIVPPYNSQDYLKLFIENRIDGAVFIAPPVDDQNIKVLSERELPFVVINSRVGSAPRIDIDNRAAGWKMMEYLYGLGHRKIGIIAGYMKSPNAVERFEAYIDFMSKKGLLMKEDWILVCDFQMETAYRKVKELYMKGNDLPTAFFACNDQMAIGVLKALQELDISVPGDVSVVGFDDIDLTRHISPALTTIRQPFQKMGGRAGRILVDMISGKLPEEEYIIETQLIIRKSTASVKADNYELIDTGLK